MATNRFHFWALLPATLIVGAVGILGPTEASAQTQQPAASDQSWGSSITSGVKSGFDKVGQWVSPKPAPPPSISKDDPTSLKSPAKAGPELNVAVARLYAQSGNFPDAEQQYRLALKPKQNADYLPALLGYAQLKEDMGRPDEAMELYKQALKAHPKEAAVYNNLGLCCARSGRTDEAIAAIARATELEPRNVLYRNNVAALLIEQGRLREAFLHLKAVHGEALAYYNMGYLLNKKGKTQAAAQHFLWALRADPSLVPAQRWLIYLQRTTAVARAPQRPAVPPPDVNGPPRVQQREAPLPPAELRPRRLPPTEPRQPADGPVLPGTSYGPSAAEPAVRPLPRVE